MLGAQQLYRPTFVVIVLGEKRKKDLRSHKTQIILIRGTKSFSAFFAKMDLFLKLLMQMYTDMKRIL